MTTEERQNKAAEILAKAILEAETVLDEEIDHLKIVDRGRGLDGNTAVRSFDVSMSGWPYGSLCVPCTVPEPE